MDIPNNAHVWRSILIAALVLLLDAAGPALAASQLSGAAHVRLPDGSIGAPIANVAIALISENGGTVVRTSTDAHGRYSIPVAPARYYVIASHLDYEDYSSAPGFSVVAPNTKHTMNVFLREPLVTTVLIVRHAEKLDPSGEAPSEPLSTAGETRARRLQEVLLTAGVTAVYSTDTKRTRGTVAPLARKFRLDTQTYSDTSTLAAEVLQKHRGDVVLVAAHSPTVSTVATAFGAQVPAQATGDYDNLYVVSIAASAVSVVNLQYGADSTPDTDKNDKSGTTVLLVGKSSGKTPESQRLEHAARKAGLAAIYNSGGNNGLVAPLASTLGLTPVTFNGAHLSDFVQKLLSAHPNDTVLVAGTNDELRALMKALGARSTPILYAQRLDQLVVLSRLGASPAQIVPLRF